MPGARFRHFPLFVGSRKFAEAHGNSITVDSGDEIQIGSDGILGLSDGVTQVRIEVDYVVPVKGMSIDIWDYIMNKKEFTVRALMGGKSLQMGARFTNASMQSEAKTGAATGKATIQASTTPEIS